MRSVADLHDCICVDDPFEGSKQIALHVPARCSANLRQAQAGLSGEVSGVDLFQRRALHSHRVGDLDGHLGTHLKTTRLLAHTRQHKRGLRAEV